MIPRSLSQRPNKDPYVTFWGHQDFKKRRDLFSKSLTVALMKKRNYINTK